MYAFHIVMLLTAVMYHVSAKTPIQNNSLTYECTKEGNIIISGENKDSYDSIFALGTISNKSHSMCTVDKVANASLVTFIVGKCNLSQPVNITIMQERQNTSEYMLLGGRNVNVYELKCNQVPRGGLDIIRTFNIQENDNMTISKTPQKEVNMTMKIMDNGVNELGSNATVTIGQELQLIIMGNGGFAFLARSCSAFDGTGNQDHSRLLILNGTTQDDSVISNFSNHTDQTHTEIRATLYAFHFLNTYNVLINCTITVCQDDDISCPFPTAKNSTRRKRSALIEHHTNTLTTSFRVIDSYTIPVDKTDDSNKSGAYTGRRSLTVLVILFAAFGFARILP